MRYFLKLAYNGSAFHGWQSQPNAVSVQQSLEGALSTVTRLPVAVTGAGRTDTGVHARCMYAHFDLPEPIASKEKLLLSLNRILGKEIAVYDIIPVSPEAHARFDATERTYKYFVAYGKSPFFSDLSWQSPSLLDLENMNAAAEILLTTSDFSSFAKLHSDTKTNICDVRKAIWTPLHFTDNPYPPGGFGSRDGIVFTISADRFLRNMVRAVVGTLVDVGRGKLMLSGFRSIIEAKDRCVAGTSMPAKALFLWDVKYPYIDPHSHIPTL